MTWLRIFLAILLLIIGLVVAFVMLLVAGPEVMIIAPGPASSFTVPITTTTDLSGVAAEVVIQSDLAA